MRACSAYRLGRFVAVAFCMRFDARGEVNHSEPHRWHADTVSSRTSPRVTYGPRGPDGDCGTARYPTDGDVIRTLNCQTWTLVAKNLSVRAGKRLPAASEILLESATL